MFLHIHIYIYTRNYFTTMRRSLLNRSTSYSDSSSSSSNSSSDSSSSASSYERSDEDERSSEEEEQDETRRRRMRLRRRIRSHRASAPTRTDSEEARIRRTRIRLARRRNTSRENNTERPQRRQSTRTQNILARVRRRRESRISPSEVNQITERQQQSNNSNNSDNNDDDDDNNNNRDDESSSDSYTSSSSDIFDDTDREDDGDVPPPRRIKPSLGLTLFRVATGDGLSSSDNNNLAEVIKVQNIQALSQLTPQNSETYTAVVTSQESPRPNPSNNNNNNNYSTNDNNDIADDEQKTNLNNDNNNNAIPIATVVEQISPHEVDNMIQANANTSNTIINDLSYDDSIISGWMYKLAKIKLLGRESWHHRFIKFDISNGLLSISKDDEDNTTPYKEFNLSKIDIRIQPLNPDVETYGRKNIILVRQAQPINNTNINNLVTLLTFSCSSTSVFYRWLQAFSNVKSFVLPSS